MEKSGKKSFFEVLELIRCRRGVPRSGLPLLFQNTTFHTTTTHRSPPVRDPGPKICKKRANSGPILPFFRYFRPIPAARALPHVATLHCKEVGGTPNIAQYQGSDGGVMVGVRKALKYV